MSGLLIKIFCRNAEDKREALTKLSGGFAIVCNLLLCIFKFTVGTVSGSVSITADAVNNLSDAGSGIITIVGARLSGKPVDKEHPFGHGRIEYICALIISLLIFLMGFELGKSSIEKIISPQDVKFNIWYIIVLIAAILVKLYMAFFNNKLYKMTDNINLRAVKQDSLNDCIATGATILALLISTLTPFKRADGIIGLIVAVVIVLSGVNIVKDITGKLLGQAPDKAVVEEIERLMLSEELIIGFHDLIIHDYGHNRAIASIHAEVPSTANIVEVHEAIDRVEHKIASELAITICVHMDPVIMNDSETEKYKKMTADVLRALNEQYTFHEFKMVKTCGKINLMFELVVPYDKTKTSTDILNEIIQEFRKHDQNVAPIITIEHSFI